ncbi:hypothetical protein D3C78_1749870 [compost metagenome]
MEWRITCRVAVIQATALLIAPGKRSYDALLAGQSGKVVRGQEATQAFPVQQRLVPFGTQRLQRVDPCGSAKLVGDVQGRALGAVAVVHRRRGK